MSNNILHHLSHLALYREHDEENGISEDETSIKSYVLHLSLEGQNQEFWNIFSNKIIPDLIFVPLVGFDSNLNRLGYGGGFYDRYFERYAKKKKIIKIGLAFSFQKIKKLPTNKFDKKLDEIITEKTKLI